MWQGLWHDDDDDVTVLKKLESLSKLVSLQASITIVIHNEGLLYGDLCAVYF